MAEQTGAAPKGLEETLLCTRWQPLVLLLHGNGSQVRHRCHISRRQHHKIHHVTRQANVLLSGTVYIGTCSPSVVCLENVPQSDIVLVVQINVAGSRVIDLSAMCCGSSADVIRDKWVEDLNSSAARSAFSNSVDSVAALKHMQKV